MMNAIDLSLFSSRISAICEEMGAVLQRSAFSPNIKDRLDFSCAIFDVQGELCAQAAHIPVHLGSMAFAMRDIVTQVDWMHGDMLILNDPFLGGTHLPDVTLIAPVFVEGKLMAFVANRAHHADIGAASPGSMPISQTLEDEGMVIPPSKLMRHGQLDEAFMQSLLNSVSSPTQSKGDFTAQISANQLGVSRLHALITTTGVSKFGIALLELNDYAQRLSDSALSLIPVGEYRFSDVMDDDGMGNKNIPISVLIQVTEKKISVDFSGTAEQVKGNINCSLSVAAASVYYVFRCLMPVNTPACAGSFRRIEIKAPEGCLLNAKRPAAVAAGNVETSTRVVDVVMGALTKAIPEKMSAASQGSMNNVAMGGRGNNNWDYYETIGGGMGGHATSKGLSAVQTHMTNTLNTPIESLESHYPLRIRRYEIRKDSAGEGAMPGGEGIIREYEFLDDAEVTLLTERRTNAPWGLLAGGAGVKGENLLDEKALPPKINFKVLKGNRLTIKTPGGGGYKSFKQ